MSEANIRCAVIGKENMLVRGDISAYSASSKGNIFLPAQDWRTIYEIAKTYPRLPLIIGGMVGTDSWDAVLPLLRECKNVHCRLLSTVEFVESKQKFRLHALLRLVA